MKDFLSYSTNFSKDAIVSSYGVSSDPEEYYKTCSFFGAKGWEHTFHTGWNGKYGIGSHDFKHGCCEMRVSWRLAGRLVPVSIESFSYKGAANGKGNRTIEDYVMC